MLTSYRCPHLTLTNRWYRSEKADVRGEKADVGGEKADVGGEKADVGGEKADVGGGKADVGGEKVDMGGEDCCGQGKGEALFTIPVVLVWANIWYC